jgi:hypothetical protein
MSSPMNMDFYESEDAQNAMIDLFIDQLHQFAELEEEEPENQKTTAWVSSSADRASHF